MEARQSRFDHVDNRPEIGCIVPGKRDLIDLCKVDPFVLWTSSVELACEAESPAPALPKALVYCARTCALAGRRPLCTAGLDLARAAAARHTLRAESETRRNRWPSTLLHLAQFIGKKLELRFDQPRMLRVEADPCGLRCGGSAADQVVALTRDCLVTPASSRSLSTASSTNRAMRWDDVVAISRTSVPASG